ncbi:MAG: transglutaminase-like domain-containing protein [Bacteroidota bacterium]
MIQLSRNGVDTGGMRLLLSLFLLSLAAGTNAQTCEAPLNVRDWSRADAHALSATPQHEADLDRLATYLSRAGRSEAERARAAFRWVAAHIEYDVEAWEKRIPPHPSADSTFSNRSGVCEGYSRLLVALLDRMDIESRMITGWGLSTDDAAISPDGLHAWVAARLDGGWVLMDPTWAAGGIHRGTFVPRFRGEWFASPPDWFAKRHIPTEERWQLLDTPLSLEDAVARRIPAPSCRTSPGETVRRHSTRSRVQTAGDGPAWRESGGVRYRIHAPTPREPLVPRSRVEVRVEAPGAVAVAVFDGAVMGPTLRASGDVWSGTVRVGEYPLQIGLQNTRGGPWQMIRSFQVVASR